MKKVGSKDRSQNQSPDWSRFGPGTGYGTGRPGRLVKRYTHTETHMVPPASESIGTTLAVVLLRVWDLRFKMSKLFLGIWNLKSHISQNIKHSRVVSSATNYAHPSAVICV